jgi:hypothetical protein
MIAAGIFTCLHMDRELLYKTEVRVKWYTYINEISFYAFFFFTTIRLTILVEVSHTSIQ